MAVENNITITHPDVAKEWDYEKNNGLLPTDVTKGSTKKVFWKCQKGHSFDARIDHRCLMHTGCRFCSHKDVMPGETDLATVYPEIAAEWDYINNTDTPDHKLPFSNSKVSWICPICHKNYERKICDRTLNRMGCPHCTKPGERSTSQQEQSFIYYFSKVTETQSRIKIQGKEIDIYLPQLSAGIEYHGEYYHMKRTEKDEGKKALLKANGIRLITVKCERERTITDDTIAMETKEKANPSLSEMEWAIKESFSLLSLPMPDIDLKRDLSEIYALYIRSIKENNISTKYPDVAVDWNYELNKGLTPEMFAFASNKTVWWTCKVCGNDYDMKISNRTVNQMECPYCAGKRIKVGFNDLATTNPELLGDWDYINNHIKPEEISKGSDKQVRWKCRKCGYEWPAAISSRVAGSGCPACAGRVVVKGFNDLETLNPDVAALWNYSRNNHLPSDYTKMSNDKAWWLCPNCGHEWQAQISSISSGRRCPECAKRTRPVSRRKTMVKKKGSLADNYPELLAEWDYSKNKILPEDYPCGSDQKVWWICPNCGHSYEMSVYCRTGMKQNCPECGKIKSVVSSQKKRLEKRGTLVETCPDILDEWDYVKNERGPETYTKGSKAKVWWKCSKGHSWQAVIRTRAVLNCGCPLCSGRVRCMNVDTGEIFDNYTEAAKSIGVTRKAITFAIKHGTKCKGYRWKTIE